ncbi:23S rRNA (pseudouridine1915-N3)-methyltransferase [Rhodobium orientis]|uniref:Ribosomal RNA large subunit methyltransferase H n=1 Tax=Rhodobium orientis TaxID=34017 RepID=A0A327JQH5_9HYPH|nr:23S rRNA (pseudouridine(1915)-N(3))-methyltransferase RlmH [Rhodobium orientis]MBB4303558.1 23S rRNA (pseudouridine1915-N3)-methyltransferase [Rhodobium orientis]MBK5950487.1 23S rRNA (pseudouridine(1915)-N(3))-methyltransferase RlmH [Rhodobium orientis]RAI28301.1 23S rRNA (pseudouridine(1915)-N(3))-methyltransferase RlmH [Rhodobium orientis]
MRILVAAVGRLKAGAESQLVERYAGRTAKSGRNLGITRFDLQEIAESRARSAAERAAEEAAALAGSISPGAVVVALDETGKTMTSRAFADWLATTRDGGAPEIAFVLGGPDGHGPELLARAELKLALGAMTWPHQIARVLLLEQLYRATTILAGHPYHRE